MAKGKGKKRGKKKKNYDTPIPHRDDCPYSKRKACLDAVRVPLPIVPSHPPTPLHEAVKEGEVNTVKFLVGNGCSVNVVDAVGSTPLHWAVAYGKSNMVHYLIEKGADIDASNDFGVTPLHALVLRGDLRAVKMLVEKGAQINTQDRVGKSPLTTAVESDDVNMVCFLVNKPRLVPKENDANDANGNENEDENEDENNPQEDDRDPEEIERELRRKKRQEERDRKEREEAEREREEQERADAEKWAKPNVVDMAGWAPLHYAAARGYAEIVKVLIRAGADMNIVDSRTGDTPLHKAILHGKSQVVRYLEGADVNIKSHANIPLVQVAAMEGYAMIFRWLVEQGADFRFTDNRGWTLLHHAASNDHLSVVRYLVSELAVDIHAKNNDGLKPLMLAHDQGIKRFLQQRMLGDLSHAPGTHDDVTIGRNTSSDAVSNDGGGIGGSIHAASIAGTASRPGSSATADDQGGIMLPSSSRPSTALTANSQ